MSGFASFGMSLGEALMIWKGGRDINELYQQSAAVLRREGNIAREQGMWYATERRLEGEKLLGTVRSQYAKARVTLEGTPLLVLQREAETAEEDALMLRYTGERARLQLFEQAGLQEETGETLKEKAEYEGLGKIFEGFGNMFSSF